MRSQTTGFSSALRGKSAALPAVAVLCLLLVGMLAAVQVAHFHSNQTLGDHCPICVSLHSAAPLAIAAVGAVLLVQVGRSKPVLARQCVTRHRVAKLTTRPPPTAY